MTEMPKKIRRAVFIPKEDLIERKKERGNPNYYAALPEEGEKEKLYCSNCKKEQISTYKHIKDPIEGKPFSHFFCDTCGFYAGDGITIIDTREGV